MIRSIVLMLALLPLMPSAASAQTLGTFQWRTEPYCNVLTLTVVQHGGIFTLDGFDEPCGGNPKQPVHGVAVPQTNGSITIGLSVVSLPGGAPVNLEAGVSPTSFGGTWRDSAGNDGTLTFSPAGVSGGPRPGVIGPTTIPAAFSLHPDGGFVAGGQLGQGVIPVQGAGTRLMWHPRKAAFRAGQMERDLWDEGAIGLYSAAFGLNTLANGVASAAFGIESGASGEASVVIGSFSIAGADNAVAIGDNVTALGVGSIVLGRHARTTAGGRGSFVFGDQSSTIPMISDVANQFIVRATGGVRFMTNTNGNGCTISATSSNLLCAGTVAGGSDRTRKQDIRALDGEDVLAKVLALPVTTWSFTDTPEIRHAGPMAQDFHAAFGLGDSDTSIGYTDINGIALRAIQALAGRNGALQTEVHALRTRLELLERLLGRPR